MKPKRSRYIFLALVVPLVLACLPPEGGEETGISATEMAAEEIEHQVVDRAREIWHEYLEVVGSGFHPRYGELPKHKPICLPAGWKAEWSCPLCAPGEGRAFDFMVRVTARSELGDEDCSQAREDCAKMFEEFPPPASEETPSPDFERESPFQGVEVDAPRVVVESFSVVGDQLRVEASIPRISGDGYLRAGPLKDGFGGRCYKLEYILFDAETGEELDRIDPHIIG